MIVRPTADLSTRAAAAAVFIPVPLQGAGDMVARTSHRNRAPTVPDGLEASMEFRWIALLALWTLLSGPILTQPSPQPLTAGQWSDSPSSVQSEHSSHPAATRR